MDNETASFIGGAIAFGALLVWLAPGWITALLGI